MDFTRIFSSLYRAKYIFIPKFTKPPWFLTKFHFYPDLFLAFKTTPPFEKNIILYLLQMIMHLQ